MHAQLNRMALLVSFQKAVAALEKKWDVVLAPQEIKPFYDAMLCSTSAEYWAVCDGMDLSEIIENKKAQTDISQTFLSLVFSNEHVSQTEFSQAPVTVKELKENGHNALALMYSDKTSIDEEMVCC